MAAAGGIVGFDLYGSLLRCAAAGSVEGPDAGGLVGLAERDFGRDQLAARALAVLEEAAL